MKRHKQNPSRECRINCSEQLQNPSRNGKVNCSEQLKNPSRNCKVNCSKQLKYPSRDSRVNCREQLPPEPPLTLAKEPDGHNPFIGIHPLDDGNNASASFQATVAKLLWKKDQISPPKFRFDICKEAAEYNFNLLKENNFELETLLNPTEKCVTSYGSEFKSVEDLAKLLHRHPRWECEFPVKEIDDDIR